MKLDINRKDEDGLSTRKLCCFIGPKTSIRKARRQQTLERPLNEKAEDGA